MGMHAHGEVFFGYDLGDLYDRETYDFTGPEWLEDGETEWEDVYAKTKGVEALPYPEHIADLSNAERRAHPDYQAWSESLNAVRRTAAESGCELATYGHIDGDRYWCVRANASHVTAAYECVDLGAAIARFDGAWAAQLEEFARVLALPLPEGGPRWYLTSTYR